MNCLVLIKADETSSPKIDVLGVVFWNLDFVSTILGVIIIQGKACSETIIVRDW